MIISVNWLKKFTDIDMPIDELSKLIGSRLVEIEEIINLGERYEGIVAVKVVKCESVEGSDHLSVCKIDDGGKTEGVERDGDGLVQVVCGAPNCREGLTAVWLPPRVTVPSTFNDPKPVVLEARELRGNMSNGMLGSARELGISEEHEGIVELADEVVAGSDFAPLFELDDYLLDIENKSLTHRPDCFGIVGFAREVAGIQGHEFTTPIRLQPDKIEWIEKSGDEPTPNVTIDDPNLSDRYQAVVLTGVDGHAKSPLETQSYLTRIGVKPHSAVVDATNYLMMVAGQPLHAFDYDKLKIVNDGKIDIHVRGGRSGEKLVLLDGREIELDPSDIVIANGDTAVALAGAMGGRDTEIDDNTTNVLLEAATFNLYNLRTTQMRHGVFSEAITRFTKGLPADLTEPVLAEAVGLLSVSAGAKRASDVADAYPNKQKSAKVYCMAEHMNAALGSDFSTDDIVTTLTNVGFEVSVTEKGAVAATPPYWRTDIHISEDLDEEVGRLNGFDNIKPVLPKRDFTAVSPDSFDQVRSIIRSTLARSGANEVLTYSFVHGNLFERAAQDADNAYKLVNSISPDLQHYRQSLIPSLLNLVHSNIKAGYDEFALFELNKAHVKSDGLDEAGLPIERDFLAFVLARKSNNGGAAFYEAKHHLEFLAQELGLKLTFEPAFDNPKSANAKPFEIRRSAAVKSGDVLLGIVGEFKNSVAKAFKLPEHSAGFVVSSSDMARLASAVEATYKPLSRYPSTERDITLQVSSDVKYADVENTAIEYLSKSGLEFQILPLGIYKPDGAETRNITLRIKLTSADKTLSGDDVSEIIDSLVKTSADSLGASVV